MKTAIAGSPKENAPMGRLNLQWAGRRGKLDCSTSVDDADYHVPRVFFP